MYKSLGNKHKKHGIRMVGEEFSVGIALCSICTESIYVLPGTKAQHRQARVSQLMHPRLNLESSFSLSPVTNSTSALLRKTRP